MADDGARGGPRVASACGPGNQVGFRSAAVASRGVVALRPRYRLLFCPGNHGRLAAGDDESRRVGTPIPVHVPDRNGRFVYLGDLPPSRGTGVFVPNYALNIVHGGHEGAPDVGHGNTPGGDGAFGAGAYVGDYPGSYEAFPNAGTSLQHADFGFVFSAIGTLEPEPEIDEEEAAQLLGIHLYNQINFNT